MSAAASPPPLALAPFDIEALENDSASICALDADLCIVYVNPAWRTFALDNGAGWDRGRWKLGVRLLDAVPEVLRPFHAALFERARAASEAVEHSYECSSPTTLRIFRMRIFPCEGRTLVVAHSLSQETPHTRRASPPVARLYRGAKGIITQCSHCRRVKRALDARDWDWVPAYVEEIPANTSHGICPLCAAYYYPCEPVV